MLDILLGSKLRAKVLSWLLMHANERYFVRQLKEILHEDATNLSKELSRLAKMEILTSKTEGKQKYYQANRESPFFAELSGLIFKTSGLVDVVKDSLSPLARKIKVAFIYGSIAKERANSRSDVDLMVIGSCKFSEVVDAIQKAQEKISREINPTVYPVKEWREKLASGHHFVSTVNKTQKLFIIGRQDDLERLI